MTNEHFQRALNLSEWVNAALSASGLNQAALSDALNTRVSKKIDRSIINKMTLGKRSISAEEMLAISDITGYPLPSRIQPTPTLAIVGQVGAGAKIQLSDPYPKGEGIYRITCPPQIDPHGIVAVEVTGNSMEPAYESGDILFYSRDALGVPIEAIGRRCVVEDASGMAWVKLLRRRDGQPDGLFDLISFHADTPPMYDVTIKWAAPIKMHLGRDLVTKI